MNVKKLLSVFLIAGSAVVLVPSCKKKPTDAELKAKVETSVANPAVMVDVTKAAVTLTGTVADEAAKTAAESSAKTVEGVESVTNSLMVAPPPPPVMIADDSVLSASVSEAVKAYKGVSASVSDGVVTLSGSIKKADLTSLMQAIQGMNPKKVVNNLTVN